MNPTETHVFRPGGGVPNSALPLVIYRSALLRPENGDAVCALLERNGWGGNWIDGVYSYWHFHTRGHEVLACIAGDARIGLGGEDGIVADMEKGDVCVIPAGVGHKRVEASQDFQVAGGYPPGQEGEIVRPGDMNEEKIATEIAGLKLPDTDPVSGKADGIVELWRAGQ